MKKSANSKERQVFLCSRRGVILVALIAVIVLVINLITASYSWFTPQQDKKGSMAYSFDGKARSESCTMSTFIGAKVTGDNIRQGEYINQIRYESSGTTGTVFVSAASSSNQPGISYFKTEIINSDINNASYISLYIKNMPACTLAVTYPGNSVRTFSSGQTDCYIVRNAYVKKHIDTDVNGPGLLAIEWFVMNYNTSSNVSINLDDLYLLYN